MKRVRIYLDVLWRPCLFATDVKESELTVVVDMLEALTRFTNGKLYFAVNDK